MKKSLVLSSFLGLSLPVCAATLTWDADGTAGAPAGGTGNWDDSTALWDDTGTMVIWNNATPDSAVFGDTAGLVTLTTPISANTLAFTAAGYSITGNTLTLAGTSPAISAEADALIGSILAGSNGLIKTGADILTLTGVNNYTGGTTISNGTLRLGDGTTNPTVNSTYDIAGGATLRLQYNASGSVAQTWSKFTGAGTLALTSGKNFDTGWGALTLPNTFTGTLVMERGRTYLLAANPDNHGLGGTTKVVVRPNGHFGMWENGTAIPASVSFELEGTGYGEANYEAALRMANTASTTTIQGPVTLTGNATIGANGTGVIAQGIGQSASASLTVGTAGLNGIIELLGAAAYTGATNINRGTLLLSGGNNRLPTGTTVNFTGASTLNIGSTSQTLANLTVANGITGTITGAGGTLTLGANNLLVGGDVLGQAQTLTMAGLSQFVFNGPAKTISVGPQIYANGNERGYLTLATDNTITALKLDVGGIAQYIFSADNNTEDAQLYLGQTNVINADTINVGAEGGTRGLVQFRSGLAADPTLTIRGTAGGDSRATITVGRVGDVYKTPFTKVDLTAGVTGASVLDAKVSTLEIVSLVQNSCAAEFIMGGGTLDAITLKVSHLLSGSSYGNNFTGRFRLNGGTVKAQTIQMSQDDGTGQSYGEFYLNSGTLLAQNITAGNGSGKTFNWTTGTLQNYDASTDLSFASGTTINLLTAGSHIYDADADRTISVASAMTGVGGLTKNGDGTLTLTAVNNYTGATGIEAGTLSLTGSLTGGTAITVNNDAVFTQSAAGAISGAASFTHNSSATSTLSGANTYSGSTTVSQGILRVNGSLAPAGIITVSSGATLGGMGSGGLASLADGATLTPGLPDFTENQITLSSLSLSGDSILLFDLDTPNSLANLTPSFNSDHLYLGGALILDGKLRINPLDGFTPDPDSRWILMSYPKGGFYLTDLGLEVDLANSPGLPAAPAGYHYTIDTATDGYVFLSLAVPEPGVGAMLALGLLLIVRRIKRA